MPQKNMGIKAQYLQEEEDRLSTAEERIAEYEAQYEQGQLSEEARDYYISQEEISDEQMNGFARAKQQYEKLEALQEAGILQESEALQESQISQELQVSQESQEASVLPIYYLNESGWEYLCGEKFTQQRYLDVLLLLMALILIFSGYAAMEYQTGMNVLHESAPDGSRKVMLAKTIVAAVIGAAAAVMVYLIEMIFVIRGWGLEGWNLAAVSVQSITVLGAAVDCSIRQWMVLQGIGWMICGVFAAEIITILSRLLKRQVVAMLAGFLVLGLPVLVMLLL